MAFFFTSKSPHSSSKIAGFVVKRRVSFPTLEITTFFVKNRPVRRQMEFFDLKSPHSSSKIAGVVVKQRLSFPTLEIATFVVKNRRSRRQMASFVPNPRNRHIRRQNSPDSSSNGVFHSQPSKSPHSSSKIARFVVKLFDLEFATFVVKNRRSRRQTASFIPNPRNLFGL